MANNTNIVIVLNFRKGSYFFHSDPSNPIPNHRHNNDDMDSMDKRRPKKIKPMAASLIIIQILTYWMQKGRDSNPR